MKEDKREIDNKLMIITIIIRIIIIIKIMNKSSKSNKLKQIPPFKIASFNLNHNIIINN